MKGIVIDRGEKYYTFLQKIFVSMNHMQRNYNWLITSHECWPRNEVYAEILSAEFCWMSGDKLTEMIAGEDFQWIWGVLSAFPKHIAKEAVLEYPLPEAEGCRRIWQNPVTMQHPLAEIEIVAWDSTLTVVISKEDRIVDRLRGHYVLAKDLKRYNESLK